MSPPGKIVVATILLMFGGALFGAAAEMHLWWLAVGGCFCFTFVPVLIFEAVVEKVGRR